MTIDEMAALEPVLGASRDALESLQLERLQSTLRHAYANNPAYRRKFDAAGVAPEDLRTLTDLARFPFTTKDDLREAYPFGFFSVPREQVARIHASSGTTGKPTVVGYTHNDIATWGNLVARSIRAAGGRAGMTVHVAYGYGLFTGGLGAHYGAEAAGCTVIPMSGGQTERQVQLICDFRPDIIMVTPSYMLAILDEFTSIGDRPAVDHAARRHLRRGTVGRRHARGNRIRIQHRCLRHLWSVGGHGTRRRAGIRAHQGGADHLGRSFHRRDRGSDERPCGRGGRAGRTGVHFADQGSHAGHTLPDARSDPSAAGHPRPVCGVWPGSAAAPTTC